MSWARPESLDEMMEDISEVEALLRKALDAQKAEDEEDMFLEEERLFEEKQRAAAIAARVKSAPSYRKLRVGISCMCNII